MLHTLHPLLPKQPKRNRRVRKNPRWSLDGGQREGTARLRGNRHGSREAQRRRGRHPLDKAQRVIHVSRVMHTRPAAEDSLR